MLLHILHTLGTLPLMAGFVAQIIVVLASHKDGDRPALAQSLMLMLALGLITAGALQRPKSPPKLSADLISCAGALFLLTPGVAALIKLRGKEQGAEKGG